MNFFTFMGLVGCAATLLSWRWISSPARYPVTTAMALLLVSWCVFQVMRTLLTGTLDAAWSSYAAAGTLLLLLGVAPPSLRLPPLVFKLWELTYLGLVGAYLATWAVSGHTRLSILFDSNTEALLFLVLSVPIWMNYNRRPPPYLWALYAALLIVTLSRTSGLFMVGLLAGAILPQPIARNRAVVIATVFGAAVVLTTGVAMFDPSAMPNAVGAGRFISLNDGSFFERRELLFAAVKVIGESPQSMAFGANVPQFVEEFGNVVHSSFAELFLAGGLGGGILFVCAYVGFIWKYINRQNIGLFAGYTAASNFAVLSYNSVIFLAFIVGFLLLSDRGAQPRATTRDLVDPLPGASSA